MALTAAQKSNLFGIIRAAKKKKLGFKGAVIATMTACAEANLSVYASANVPESQKYPHQRVSWEPDGLGHDHASMGMYQQQTGTIWTPAGYGYNMNQTTINSPNGWGTPKELMDPETSTEKFFNAMLHAVPNWHKTKKRVVCQEVQRSAYDGNPRSANNYSHVYGGNYAKQSLRAHGLVLRYYAKVKV